MTITEATHYAKKEFNNIRAGAALVGGTFDRAYRAADMLLCFEAQTDFQGAPVTDEDAAKAARIIEQFAAK